MRVSKRESALPGSFGEPLIAESVDLRNYCWMKLDVCRLAASDFFHLADNEEFGAGVKLWTAAMRQVPAGSLPNNNRIIASLAGYANAPRRWSRVREMALYGWVPCSDGRLYHPVLAELVTDIQESLMAKKNRVDVLSPQEERKRKTRERVRRWRMAQKEMMEAANQDLSGPVMPSGVSQPSVTGSVTVTQKSVTGCVTDSVTVTHVIEEEEKKNREREESNTHRNAESVTNSVTRSVTDGVTKGVTDSVTKSVTDSVTQSEPVNFLGQNNRVAAPIDCPDQEGGVPDWCALPLPEEWDCIPFGEPDDTVSMQDEFFDENIFVHPGALSGDGEATGVDALPRQPMPVGETECQIDGPATKDRELSRTMAILFPDTVEEEATESSPASPQQVVSDAEVAPVADAADASVEIAPVPEKEADAEAGVENQKELQQDAVPEQNAAQEAVEEADAGPAPDQAPAESRSADGEPVHSPSDEGIAQRASATPSRFEEFWSVYPNKVGRKPCLKKWKTRKLDRMADQIIAHIQQASAQDARWLAGYIPNPLTYLNQDRWEDEIKVQNGALHKQSPENRPGGQAGSGFGKAVKVVDGKPYHVRL